MDGSAIAHASAVSSPSPHGQVSSRASSALAAVSIVLILLYLFWRFIWQIKKRATSIAGDTATSSPSSSSSALQRACHGAREAERSAGETTTLPVFVRVEAAAAGSGAEKADCAVCLGELGAGEDAARLVPGCGHGFHVECIEAWFRVNSTCPLCRATVAVTGHSRGGSAMQSMIVYVWQNW